MRILISGSRNWVDHSPVRSVILGAYERSGGELYVRHGAAAGVDRIAHTACIQYRQQGMTIYPEPFPALWQHPQCDHAKGHRNGVWYCKAAGPLRNQRMLDADGRVDECHFYPLPDSRGTWDMWDRSEAAGIPCYNHGVRRV